MKKITIALLIFAWGSLAFAGPKKNNLKFLKTIETTFERPVFVANISNLSGGDFPYSSFMKQDTKLAKQNYISNFLKLKDINIIDDKNGVFIVKSRDAIKKGIPVYKESLPDIYREQMMTLIKTLPKNKRGNEIVRSLRSVYSKDGDIKVSKNGRKLIISDWAFNIEKIVTIIEFL